MNSKNNLYIFRREINLIKDSKIRIFVNKALRRAYQDFYKDPASQGHHHRMKGGLVLHTKKAVYIALQKIRMYGYDSRTSDLLISAVLLHDITKYVKDNENHRAKFKTHPYTVRVLLWDLAKIFLKKILIL